MSKYLPCNSKGYLVYRVMGTLVLTFWSPDLSQTFMFLEKEIDSLWLLNSRINFFYKSRVARVCVCVCCLWGHVPAELTEGFRIFSFIILSTYVRLM